MKIMSNQESQCQIFYSFQLYDGIKIKLVNEKELKQQVKEKKKNN